MRRTLACFLVVTTAGCGVSRLVGAEGALGVSPQALALPDAFVGASTHASLEVRNTGQGARAARVEVSGPFSATSAVLEIAGGSATTLEVTFTPLTVGAATGTLRLLDEDQSLEVALSATARAVPACPPPGPCRSSTFDALAGRCEEAHAPDGTACGDACLNSGQCLAGECVGVARACDDANPCTLDSCDGVSGCVHVDQTASCPADACHVPTCSPGTGCGVAPVADGTGCGSTDCALAHVCLGGQCVARPSPDGASCGAPSPCQPAGVCQGGQCARQPATPLQPLWSHPVPAGSRLWSPLMADPAGNLHWLECSQQIPCQHVSFTEDGVLRFQASVPDVFAPGGPVLLTQGLMIAGENTAVDAVQTSTGAVAWKHDFVGELTTAAPSCGAGRPYLNALADDGRGGIFVQFQSEACGASAWNGTWTLRLDTQTGATLWAMPSLGAWVTGCDTYGGGRIVSDELGRAFVTKQLGCGNQTPTLTSLDGTGTQRWTQSTTLGRGPLAVFGGTLYDEVVNRLDTNGGALLGSVPLASGYWGVEALVSPRGSYLFQGTIGSRGVNLYRLGPQGAVQWMLPMRPATDGGTEVQLSETPTLTTDDSVLFAASPQFGSPSAESALIEIGADGGEAFRCALPAAGFEFYGVSVLLPSGKWIAVHWDSWFTVEAFDAAPLAPAKKGWICPGGGPAHSNRPL